MKLYRPLLWFGGAVLFLAIAPFLGSETLHPTNLWDPDTLGYRIFWNLRYPRFILAMGAGGALAVLGAIYQNLFRNPLCEPYVLGISSAVTLGILVGEIIWGFLPMSWPSMGIGMVAAVLLIIFLLSFASSRFGTSSEKVVLFGLGINFILSSLLFLGLSFQSQNVGGGSLRWFFGFIPWIDLRMALLFLFGSILFTTLMMVFSRALDALSLGDSVARTLGVSPQLTRNILLLATSLVLGLTVSVVGTIGFVGLVIPHLTRLIFRPATTRALLPQVFLLGAVFLSVADGISRAILPPFEFPVGVITTLIGGPLFLLVLWRRN